MYIYISILVAIVIQISETICFWIVSIAILLVRIWIELWRYLQKIKGKCLAIVSKNENEF